MDPIAPSTVPTTNAEPADHHEGGTVNEAAQMEDAGLVTAALREVALAEAKAAATVDEIRSHIEAAAAAAGPTFMSTPLGAALNAATTACDGQQTRIAATADLRAEEVFAAAKKLHIDIDRPAVWRDRLIGDT